MVCKMHSQLVVYKMKINHLNRDKKKIKLDTQKILFARPAPAQDPDDGVSYAYVHELTLDRAQIITQMKTKAKHIF